MKKILMIICVAVICILSLQASAQNCKPDYSQVDKITKQQTTQWGQVLFETSFGHQLWDSSSVETITCRVGRYGNENAISIVIQKQENSIKDAAFEPSYRAENGNQFFFGFKDGEPLAFTSTEVANKTEVPHSVLAGFSGTQLVTTVVLAATIQNKDLAALRDALTTKRIDAVRVGLAGNALLDKAVNEKNGEKMKQNFACFFQFLDKNGIDLNTPSAPPSQPAPAEPAAKPAEPPKAAETPKAAESQVAAAQIACPFCKVMNQAGSKFCKDCGKNIQPITCPKCKTINPADAKFCSQCAEKLI
jgi:hypothetical protein